MRFIITILLFFFCSNMSGQIPGLKCNKLIEDENFIYRVKQCKDEAILIREDCTKSKFTYFKLPIEITDSEFVAFDINEELIYTISIFGASPIEYAFKLVKSPLVSLDTFNLKDTLHPNNGLKLYNVTSIEETFDVPPLLDAFINMQTTLSGFVYFDIAVGKHGSILLIILQEGQLSLWELNNNSWEKKKTTAAIFNGPFVIAALKDDILLVANGEVYEWQESMKTINVTSPGAIPLVGKKGKELVVVESINISSWQTKICTIATKKISSK